MTFGNWIELGVLLVTLIGMGIPLIHVSKKVKDLDGVDMIEPGRKQHAGNIISGQ